MFQKSFHRPFRILLGPIVALLVSACGANSEISRPSTYVGPIVSAHMNDLYLAVSDDKRVGFDEVFRDFQPQTGLLTDALPFPKVAVTDIVYAAAQPVAEYYDSKANDNGYLEGPELLVLYIREAAIGLGHPVEYIGVNPRVDALATSNSDIGGLMEFVNRHQSEMNDKAQALFKDIERLGLDWRNRGRSGKGSAR